MSRGRLLCSHYVAFSLLTVFCLPTVRLFAPNTQAVATTIQQELNRNLPYIERSSLGAMLLVPGLPAGINLRPDVVKGQACVTSNWRNDGWCS